MNNGKRKPMTDKKPAVGIEPKLIRELATILRDSGLSEIEIEQGGLRLRLAASAAPAAMTTVHVPVSAAPAPMAALPAPSAPAANPAAHPGAVLSPMVGTAYLSSEPGAPVFIKLGDQVQEGQTLLIVEAMKTFNPIPAPHAGRVAQILVTDAQPVEYGQALVILE
jgi:acetyl-CoA carboxylase biotin carboxyl carrier protein